MGVRVIAEQEKQRRILELETWCDKAANQPSSRVYQVLHWVVLEKCDMTIPEIFAWLALNKSDHYLSTHARNCGPRIEQKVYEWMDGQKALSDGPDVFAALAKVIAALGPLESHDAKRVLYAAAVFFGIVHDDTAGSSGGRKEK